MWPKLLIVMPLLAVGCATSAEEASPPETTASASASPVVESPTTSVPAPTSTSTSSSARPGDCLTSVDRITLDRAWDVDTEIELLVDTSVTFASAPSLRNARQITIRSGPQVDGVWHLTMVDPVGERVANYASQLPISKPVDTEFVINVDYTVRPDGAVAFESLETATAINVGYADFVFDVFGATDGELGEDRRFDRDWLNLVAAGGLELLDPSSAAERTLALLTVIHAHHGDTFILDEASTYTGEWREAGLPGTVPFSEILVEASVAPNGCVEIESTATQAAGETTGSRSVYVDPSNGVFLGSLSLVRIPSDDGDIRASTAISTLNSSLSD